VKCSKAICQQREQRNAESYFCGEPMACDSGLEIYGFGCYERMAFDSGIEIYGLGLI
jgi:hypothetical protein